MISLVDKSKIWSLIEKYDNRKEYSDLVESLSNILKGEDLADNLIRVSPYLDLNFLERKDLSILDKVFSEKLESILF